MRPQVIEMQVQCDQHFTMALGSAVNMGGTVEHYTGEYTVTPSQTAQVLNTADLYLIENVTVEAIPSNYGLISWNGSALTVS